MAHPYHHAISSQKRNGGEVSDYQAIHDWFDSSKESLPDVRHRQVLHNSFGIFLAEERFGTVIRNSSGRMIPVRLIGEQHVTEDCGFIPTPAQAVSSLEHEDWMDRNIERDHPLWHSARDVTEWGGMPEDYVHVHKFMERSRRHVPDSRHRALFHNSFGISVIEGILGSSLLNSDGRLVPVREILEGHVLADLGVVPSLDEAFHGMRVMPWMSRAVQTLPHYLGGLPGEWTETKGRQVLVPEGAAE